MRFVVDAQLSPALARLLVDLGHEAEHVGDCGLASAPDSEIWRYADSASATIITKDDDFARRKITRSAGPPIVWVCVPNTRRRELLAYFATMLPAILDALERGEALIEISQGPAHETPRP